MSNLSNKQFSDPFGRAERVQLSPQDVAAARRLLTMLLPPNPDDTREGSRRDAAGGGVERRDASASELADAARAILLARQSRRGIFAGAMFSEPAWDMLLSLYLAEHDQVRLTVTRLAEQSGAPLTTAIRWLDYLEQSRLVERSEHPTDRRIIFIKLSGDGRAKLRSYFIALIDAGHVRS